MTFGDDEHPIPMIGRGESLATGYAQAAVSRPAAAHTQETMEIAEEDPSMEKDVEANKEEQAPDDIEQLQASKGWMFPQVKVRVWYASYIHELDEVCN